MKRPFRDGDRGTEECAEGGENELEGEKGGIQVKADKLQQNNMRDVWLGMKMITGFKVKRNQGSLREA